MALARLFLISFATLLSLQPTISTTSTNGFSLSLMERDSVHSPLYPGNLTTAQWLRRHVEFSEARLLWLKSSTRKTDVVDARPLVTYDAFKYLVKLGVGTPAQNQLLVLDTGSDTTWVQCHPCDQCFPQIPPIYEYGKSSSFKALPCSHLLCPHTCANGVCQFSATYRDKTYTKGFFATETLIATTKTGQKQCLGPVVIGCSKMSSIDMFHGTVKIDGVLGMGGGALSFPSQLGERIQKRFSYCLLPLGDQGFSYLRFGSDIMMKGNEQSTPFVPSKRNNFYYLDLQGISVNGARLKLPPGTFSLRPDGSGGCLLESGSTFSRIIKPAYDVVKTTLLNYFRAHSITIFPKHPSGLDLCFHMPKGFGAFPTMNLHFAGANLLLGKEHLFYIDNASLSFCLTINPDDHQTVIGSSLQANTRFVFDLRSRRLSFAPERCAQK